MHVVSCHPFATHRSPIVTRISECGSPSVRDFLDGTTRENRIPVKRTTRWWRSTARCTALAVVAMASTLGLVVAAPSSNASASVGPTRDPVASTAAFALVVLRSGDHQMFDRTRQVVAGLAASPAGVDADALDQAWSQTDSPHLIALLTALSEVGTPYRSNLAQPGVGFDCSGLTLYAWAAAGIDLPHQSEAQLSGRSRTTAENVRAGDLMHVTGHVMISLGVGRAMVHSPNSGRTVEIGAWTSEKALTVVDPRPAGSVASLTVTGS